MATGKRVQFNVAGNASQQDRTTQQPPAAKPAPQETPWHTFSKSAVKAAPNKAHTTTQSAMARQHTSHPDSNHAGQQPQATKPQLGACPQANNTQAAIPQSIQPQQSGKLPAQQPAQVQRKHLNAQQNSTQVHRSCNATAAALLAPTPTAWKVKNTDNLEASTQPLRRFPANTSLNTDVQQPSAAMAASHPVSVCDQGHTACTSMQPPPQLPAIQSAQGLHELDKPVLQHPKPAPGSTSAKGSTTITTTAAALKQAVAIAVVKAKREREAEAEQWKQKAQKLENDVKRLKSSTMTLLAILKRQIQGPDAAKNSLLNNLLAQAGSSEPDSQVAASDLGSAQGTQPPLSSALQDQLPYSTPNTAITAAGLQAFEREQQAASRINPHLQNQQQLARRQQSLQALLQGMHAVQLAVSGSAGAASLDNWSSEPPHQVVISFLRDTLLPMPSSDLRQAHIKQCCGLIATLQHSKAGSSAELLAITADATAFMAFLLEVVAPTGTTHAVLTTNPMDAINNPSHASSQPSHAAQPSMHSYPEAARSVIQEMLNVPSLAQQIMLTVAQEIQRRSKVVAKCGALCHQRSNKVDKQAWRETLIAASTCFSSSHPLFELWDQCCQLLPTWCSLSLSPGPEEFLDATVDSLMASYRMEHQIGGSFTCYSTAVRAAVAGVAAVLQHIAQAPEFASSRARETCRRACRVLKEAFMPIAASAP